MTSLEISAITFCCVFGGASLGLFLRPRLREHHLTPETKDLVKLGVGIIATMTALVLGLLVASAKSSFDAQRTEIGQMSANVVLLDRALAHYGPDAKEARQALRGATEGFIDQLWPAADSRASQAQPTTNGEVLYDKIQELRPKTDAQRSLQNQAIKTTTDLGQIRWLLFAQKSSAISIPFLTVVIFWLTVTFGSFGLFAPRNAVVFITLFLCSVSVAGALGLVVELDKPFEGLITISSEPLRNALAQLGK